MNAMNSPHVIVVGGGLAGLSAAYELQRCGYAYTLLEAESDYLGGRIRTIPLGEYNGKTLLGEAGAMRIPNAHTKLLNLVNELGLATRPVNDAYDNGYAYLRGTFARKNDIDTIAPAFDLGGEIVGRPPESLWRQVMSDVLGRLSPSQRQQLFEDRPRCQEVLAMDKQSLLELLEKQGLNADEIELIASSMALEPLLDSAATEHLREELSHTWCSGFVEICGGMYQLPAALAARLVNPPLMGCAVIRIERRESGRRTRVLFTKNGREEEIEGDLVVCTVPCPVMDNIQFDPPLHSAKRRAIRQVRYESAHKILAVTQYRFWETEHQLYGGSSCSDLPTGMTYYPSDNPQRDPDVSQSPGVILASYTWGAAARRLGALSEASLARLVPLCMSDLHNTSFKQGMFKSVHAWNWDNHHWSGGGFAMFSPGQHARLFSDLVSNDGPIYFAGEHTSLQHSWMQGALESAHRVVASIVNRQQLH